MGLGDCPKCWDHHCSCGYNYIIWSNVRIENLIKILEWVKKGKQKIKIPITYKNQDAAWDIITGRRNVMPEPIQDQIDFSRIGDSYYVSAADLAGRPQPGKQGDE